MPVGEAALLTKLADVEELTFDRASHTDVSDLRKKFTKAIEKEHRNKYYQSNWVFIVLGIVLSLALLAWHLFNENGVIKSFSEAELFLGVFMLFFTAIAITILLTFTKAVFSSFKLNFRINIIITLAVLGFLTITILSFFVLDEHGEIPFLADLISVDLRLIIPVLGIVGLNILFYFLMGAPTRLGRDMMDWMGGLKLYLSMAEKDRMDMTSHPTMSPKHYEALLPYAIALGVESNWSAAFAIWLNKAVAVDPSNQYQPHWNRDWHGGGFDRSCNFQESFQSNYASSMPPTSSSESSGGFSSGSGFSSMGGFSGGGGGGGGGGGW